MKQLNVFIATLVITCFSMLPAIALADDHELDDLDVTMDVVDDLEGIDDIVNEMPGPEETELYLGGESGGATEGDGATDEEAVADTDGENEGAEAAEEESESTNSLPIQTSPKKTKTSLKKANSKKAKMSTPTNTTK
jgi:hypothetical protein